MKYLTLGICLILLTACGHNYSNGSRVGVVTKLSEKGLIWKSWEGEMNMGGMRMSTDEHGNQSAVVNVFEFNVAPEAVEQVKAAQLSGKPVELVYRQWLIAPLSISNKHVIIAVK
jgi:hypothetical protein